MYLHWTIRHVYATSLMICVYFLILLAMLMSTYLSPMETIIPPMMVGSTLDVSNTDSFFCTNVFSTVSSCFFWAASNSFAVIT